MRRGSADRHGELDGSAAPPSSEGFERGAQSLAHGREPRKLEGDQQLDLQAQGVAEGPGQAIGRDAVKARIGRFGRQEEIDGAVLFLLSPASSYVTGMTLTVDGGLTSY